MHEWGGLAVEKGGTTPFVDCRRGGWVVHGKDGTYGTYGNYGNYGEVWLGDDDDQVPR